MSRIMVVELVGPIVDDRGVFLKAIDRVLAGVGVELRPGAMGQVAGAELDWAIRTLLEGHGRDDLLGRLGDLQHRVTSSWQRLVDSDEIRVAAGADSAWQRLVAAPLPPMVLSSMPRELVRRLEVRFGLDGLAACLVMFGPTGGGSGLPRSVALVEALERAGVAPSDVVAAVASPAAVLGAAGARCGQVVQVGLPTGVADGMPVDRFVGGLDDLLQG